MKKHIWLLPKTGDQRFWARKPKRYKKSLRDKRK